MSEPKPSGLPTFYALPRLPEIDWKCIEASIELQIQLGLQRWRGIIERLYREKAELELHHSSAKYLRGVQVSVVKDGVEATISGWFPVATEEGVMQPFDLKPGFLGGRAYRVIPVGELGAPKFRTVSVNSPPKSWWHPGLQARHISEQVKEEAEREAQRIFPPLFERVTV